MASRLRLRLPIFGTLAVLAASPFLLAAAQQKKQVVLPSGSRIRIVVQSSEARLEDIQESVDGTRLITHDRGYAPRLWENKSHRLLSLLGGHTDPVSFVTFSPDGKYVLTLADNEVRLWDSLRAHPLQRVAAPKGSKFTCAVFSEDSQKIAAGTDKGAAAVYLASNGSLLSTLTGHAGGVLWTSFSADGKQLLTTSRDKTARVWSLATKKATAVLSGHTEAVRWGFFSPDGKRAVTTGLDNTARVWDSATGKQAFVKPHYIGRKGDFPITLMAAQWVGPTKSDVVVADEKGTMDVLDGKTGVLKRKLAGHLATIREMRRSLDGKRLATAAGDGIRMWDVASGKQLPYREPLATPTAGEFSPDGSVFWMGYDDGSIRQHDLSTGEYRSETYGAVLPIQSLKLLKPDRMLVRVQNLDTIHSARDLAKGLPVWAAYEETVVSPTGDRLYIYPYGDESAGMVVDTNGKWISGLQDAKFGAFSADGTRIVSLHGSGNVSVVDAQSGKTVRAWAEEKSLEQVAVSADGTFVLTTGHKGNKILQWSVETGTVIFEINDIGEHPGVAISPNGKLCAVASTTGVMVYEASTGSVVFKDEVKRDDLVYSRVSFSPSSGQVLVQTSTRTHVYDLATKKETINRESYGLQLRTDNRFSADGKRVLIVQANTVLLCDTVSGRVVASMPLASEAQDAQFLDGFRILTTSATEGITAWDARVTETVDGQPVARRLGSFLTLSDGSWLVVDSEGRYDATDPSNVIGAHFVLEWSGGLEPIAIPQLKQQFYEPNLWAKILGLNTEAVRVVPRLEDLHLSPAVELEKSKKVAGKIEVSIRERDGGGIGKVSVLLNGKLVSTKTGVGFFTFDTSAFGQYLLPETHLPKGRGNLLQVEATNEKGDLSSEPVTLDIGVPNGLKAPDVKLYALCVGAGNYVGSKGDLQAPPSDAISLGKAIKQVGERFLPSRVTVDVLTTDSADAALKPTRPNILKWFETTAKKATSSDIVLVFFAGHGMSQIGNQKGYFFLTSEADPSDVNNLIASTSTISGDDLRAFLTQVPANKQVVILDTCHSGAAASSLISQDRSLSGDYQRAWESIKDSTGTWMLAGAAADQLSYESSNVEHGMLTYSLLEAIDHASADGLRSAPSGEFFVDVERWLTYAANRVESLKNEVGLKGVQRPEFKRSKAGSSFDIGVTSSEFRGAVGLKAPRPVVIVGNFSFEEEDPVGLEEQVRDAMKGSESVKPWFDIAKHPNVYRIAGNYSVDGETVKLKLFLQVFDDSQTRKTLETIELDGPKGKVGELALRVRGEVESRVKKLEEARKAVSSEAGSAKPPSG